MLNASPNSYSTTFGNPSVSGPWVCLAVAFKVAGGTSGGGSTGGIGPGNSGFGFGSSPSSAPAATFLYRQLGPNNDPLWGQGSANFLRDAAAVAQAIYSRLLLFEGEWWESVLDGTPMWQSILGVANSEQQISLLLQNRILGTPYVTGLTNVQVQVNQAARSFTMSADAQTAFGPVPVTVTPQPPAQGIP